MVDSRGAGAKRNRALEQHQPWHYRHHDLCKEVTIPHDDTQASCHAQQGKDRHAGIGFRCLVMLIPITFHRIRIRRKNLTETFITHTYTSFYNLRFDCHIGMGYNKSHNRVKVPQKPRRKQP